MKEIIKTTCPRDCYDGCGIAVIKRDGVVRKVLGDPDHPVSRGALCGKCALAYNGVWRDPKQRLSQPLRRVGPKGEGRFEAITWDEALEAVADALRREAEAGTPERVLHSHYTGTCSLLAGHFPQRFFNHFGATEIDPDSICNAAGHVALNYLYGASAVGFDPKTVKDSACVVVWGANPSASAPHTHKHWLGERPCPLVVIDPVRHETADMADLYLQPFPGSDAALAFGLLHILRRDGQWDEAFLAANTLGWEEIIPAVEAAAPAWTAEATGIPEADIEEAARLYSAGPALLWLGQGLQRQPQGGNVFRACGLLPAVTGNLAKPGAGIYYLNGTWAQKIDGAYVERADLRSRESPAVSHMDLVDVLNDPARAAVFMSWNMNVAASGPRQAALQAALAREDLFTVVIELFQTDTADYADIILPAASFLEFDDLVTPYFNLFLSAQAKVEEPPGEALPNQEIFRRLARALGANEPALFEEDRAILDHVLDKSPVPVTFDRLKEIGTLDPWDEPRIQFERLQFHTPSGKIEIASEAAAGDGHPRLPQSGADPRPAAGKLRLLSPASKWTMNDSYANDPKVREQLGDLAVTLHPDDAKALGLADGSLARVASGTGALDMRVAVDAVVPRGAALSCKGHWPRVEAARSAPRANINALNPGTKTDMGESSAVHGVEVTVSAAG